MIRCLIIDDEQPARDLIKKYLETHTDINLITECADGFAGVKAIQEHKPDLIFLDIQMPKLTGFEMLEIIEHKPIIVFTTAYDEFALKAFEQSAVDYLLKPFSKTRFDQALTKVRGIIQNQATENESKINTLKEYVEASNRNLERVIIKKGSQLIVVPLEKIKYIEAQDDYVMIYTADGKYLHQKTMKYFEDNLDSSRFIRIHRSYIANITEIDKIELLEKEQYLIILKDKTHLKASKAGYQKLKELL